MRLPDNTPKQYTWFEDKGLDNPHIEDGNTPDGTDQGRIYTSEVTSVDGYNIDYVAPIISAVSSRTSKGNDYSSDITIRYRANLVGNDATNPGFFGSNLIGENDTFTILSNSNDFCRGIVTKVLDISYVQLSSTLFEYEYKLQCSILQGDPLTIRPEINEVPGDTFLWKRSMIMDEQNFNDANAPINLSASLNYKTREVFFYWDNVNQESREYRLSFRYSLESKNLSPIIIKVHGNTANSDTELTPFVSSSNSQLSCIRIDKQGIDMNSDRMVEVLGTGYGAKYATKLDDDGALLINEFHIIGSTLGTNKITILSEKMRRENTSLYPFPNNHSYVEGLPELGATKHFYVDSVTPLTYNTYEVNLRDAETGNPVVITAAWQSQMHFTHIKTHDGIYAIAYGTGYDGAGVKAQVKRIPDNVKAYIDPEIPGTTIPAPGTTWAWAVSAIYDDINKLYTQWSIEDYVHF